MSSTIDEWRTRDLRFELPRRNRGAAGADLASKPTRPRNYGRLQSFSKRAGERSLREAHKRPRCSNPKMLDAAGPIELVAVHRSDDLRDAGTRCSRSRAGAAVMDDHRDSREQHFVAHVAHTEAISSAVDDVEPRPAFRE